MEDRTANIPTQLWIAARYMEAFSFIAAFIFLYNKARQNGKSAWLKAEYIFLVYSAIASFIMLAIFYGHFFPDAYIEGSGLTPFKKISEYVISGLFIVSIALLFKKRKLLDSKIANLLSLALITKILAELSFSVYVGVYDFPNMLGHLFKFISFLLLYKAVLEIGLMEPYRFLFFDLKRSQDEYRLAQGELQRRIEDDLGEAYKYIGVANRKISILLEIEKHSEHKKNKQELIAHIVNAAKSACHASVALMYKHENGDIFSLVFGEGISPEMRADLAIVPAQKAEFIKGMVAEKKRINSPCELYDAGCFNENGRLSYFVAAPFIIESVCKGFLFLGFEKRQSIAQQELEFLDIFSIHISSALAKLKVIRQEG